VLHAGVLQLAAMRPLLQAYLNTGLIRWFHVKHNVTKAQPLDSKAMFVVHALVSNTRLLLPRVVLQITAPAVVLIALGALVFHTAGPAPGIAAEAAADEEVFYKMWLLETFNPPADVVAAYAGSLGLAALASQALFCIGTLALHRAGVLTHVTI
jgi:hypothetical protein